MQLHDTHSMRLCSMSMHPSLRPVHTRAYMVYMHHRGLYCCSMYFDNKYTTAARLSSTHTWVLISCSNLHTMHTAAVHLHACTHSGRRGCRPTWPHRQLPCSTWMHPGWAQNSIGWSHSRQVASLRALRCLIFSLAASLLTLGLQLPSSRGDIRGNAL
jgi:hypothetical protein